MSSEEPRAERELVELDRDECLALMATEPIGRVASAVPGGAPVVVPVNFLLDGADPVFRTDWNDSISHLIGERISFQVDRFDYFHRTGWSVLVHGVGELVDVADADRILVEPWAPGDRPLLIRVVTSSISGRSIDLHLRPLDGRAYL